MQQKKTMDWEKDYKFLEEKFKTLGLDNPDVLEGLEALRQGEEAFFWESPLVASAEEALEMARRAAELLAPEPGREIMAAAVHVIPDVETDFDTVCSISETIQKMIPEDGTTIFGMEFSEEKGIRFVVATAERRTE